MRISRRTTLGLTVSAFMTATFGTAMAQDAATSKTPQKTLITNVIIFDGTSKSLITGQDLTLSGNTITGLVAAGGDAAAYDTLIGGKGGYLIACPKIL